MSVSILEALENADYNLQRNGEVGFIVAKDQLHVAVTLLVKGYSLDDEVGLLIEGYTNVEDVLEKQED